LVAIEAGLSWEHPQLGVLSNEHCVQAAERTGAVHDIGQWLLRTADAAR
jgi:EAL domain-containing protein (putative c-di-GMP-specific phosphodiesterase class I)